MKKLSVVLIILIFSSFPVKSQEKQNFKIMCYNVENFFDCVDDSLTNDSEYLQGGMRGWNYTKYQKKQANIARVITAVGGWDAPALVGLCEIESDKCLFDLTHYSGLKNLRYKFLHHESSDPRGIDVALLYQPRQFKPIHNQAIRIDYPNAPNNKTRDILFVSGIIPNGDTLHVFVAIFLRAWVVSWSRTINDCLWLR
jgi:predicted extracellular nuclease